MGFIKHGREIICLHIGQAGIQIGSAVWELMKVEHELDYHGNMLCYCPDPLIDNTHSLFHEIDNGRFCPRSLFIDTESMVIDEIRDHIHYNSFENTCLISGSDCASGNFGRGFHYCANEMMGNIFDHIRHLIEKADMLNGFILFHAIGGGTGSGLTGRITEKIRQLNPKSSTVHLCISSSPSLSTSVVEPYNEVLALASFGNEADLMVLFDNQALYNICSRLLKQYNPKYINLNRRISQIFSSLTTSYRYFSQMSSDFSIFQTNLVPYPGIHYPIVSYVPFTVDMHASPDQLAGLSFNLENQTISIDPSSGKYTSCCLLYRGENCCPSLINYGLKYLQNDSDIHFVDWCPSHFKVSISGQLPGVIPCTDIEELPRALCNLGNTTSITKIWDRLKNHYSKLLEKKAYLHWFISEGIEKTSFDSALDKLVDQIEKYKDLESFCESEIETGTTKRTHNNQNGVSSPDSIDCITYLIPNSLSKMRNSNSIGIADSGKLMMSVSYDVDLNEMVVEQLKSSKLKLPKITRDICRRLSNKRVFQHKNYLSSIQCKPFFNSFSIALQEEHNNSLTTSCYLSNNRLNPNQIRISINNKERFNNISNLSCYENIKEHKKKSNKFRHNKFYFKKYLESKLKESLFESCEIDTETEVDLVDN